MIQGEIKQDGATPTFETLPRHCAEELTGKGNLAHITLGEQVYILRITRAGKLILTK